MTVRAPRLNSSISHGGVWRDIALADCVLGAQGGGTWLVIAANVITLKLWEYDRTKHFVFDFQNTDISGTPSVLTIELPYALTTRDEKFAVGAAFRSGAAFEAFFVRTQAMSPTLFLFPASGPSWNNGTWEIGGALLFETGD